MSPKSQGRPAPLLASFTRLGTKAAGLLLWLPVVLLPASMLLPYEHATLGEFHLNVNGTSYFAEVMSRTGRPPLAFNSELFIGLPNPVFYGPILFRILGLLALWLHPGLAVRVAALALFAAQFYLVRRSLLRAGSSRALAGTVATLTIWTLYPLTNLYHRGAHGEFFGVGLLTCAVFFWFDALTAKTVGALWRRTLACALCWTLSIGTHAITGACSVVALLLLLTTLPYHRTSVGLRPRFAALGVGLVLGALVLSAWAYAVWSFRKDLNIQRPAGIFETPYDKLWLRLFPLPLDPEHLQDTKSRIVIDTQINLPLVLVVGAAFLAAVRSWSRDHSRRRLLWLALPVALGIVTLLLSGRAYFFRYLPRFMEVVQFPYRLISQCNLFFLLALFFLLIDARRRAGTGPKALAVSPIVLAVAVTLSGAGVLMKLAHAYPIWLEPKDQVWLQPLRSNSKVRQELATGHLVYQAADYVAQRLYAPLEVKWPSSVRTVQFHCGTGDHFAMTAPCVVNLDAAGHVLTNVAAFPWNHLFLDGQPVDPASLRWRIDESSPAHLPALALSVPAGEHRIETAFRPPLAYLVLGAFSDAALVLWSSGLFGVSVVAAVARAVRRARRLASFDASAKAAPPLAA
jgi:hypothetical protein